ncbi:aldo/keto reductase [Nocardia farcinica]|uniref:aldo/keto reductase n=1 Tax=Nocardia farcinica TaxID=37329 RepID=UPI001895EC38|nr:aldo/keto reductase [Nocardia farcinica]MBF6251889.1 aldo/keto reductase [Nocardia farcinica]
MILDAPLAATSGEFSIGGDLRVRRMGYGTMQLTGHGCWGEPTDLDKAVRVLRRAVELGVNHIDTADAYGPTVAEDLIRRALHPYPDGLVVATKGGMTRQGPNRWTPVGRAPYLRHCLEMSLRRLGVDTIDLYYLHRIDPQVELAEQIGALALMREEGKIRHIGLSKVTVAQLERAQQITPIAAVQNLFNLAVDRNRAVLDYCTENRTAFVPYAPLAAGSRSLNPRLALQWLLRQSPVVLPIPGTADLEHLEANVSAAC